MAFSCDLLIQEAYFDQAASEFFPVSLHDNIKMHYDAVVPCS